MKLEELEKTVAVAAAIAKLALQIGISIGVLAIIIYCGRIDYYPTGVTIGDSFLFIAASLAASFTYALVVLGLFSAGIALSPILRYLQRIAVFATNIIRRNRVEKVREFVNFPPIGWDKLGVAVFGLFMLLIITLKATSDFDVGFGLLAGALLMGLIYGLWHTEPPKAVSGTKGSERKVKIGLAIVVVLIPLIATKSQGSILDQTMRLIGVRNEAAVVQISEKYAKFLESNGVTAESPITKDGAIYKRASILFQGIGTNAVVEIGRVKLVLPASDLSIASNGTLTNTSSRTVHPSAALQAATPLK